MKLRCSLLLARACFLIAPAAFGQSEGGSLTGSLESNSIWDDEADSPYKGFHSNNYLKLDYRRGGLSAGLQGEWLTCRWWCIRSTAWLSDRMTVS